MRGFILAAGFGTRLRPITDHIPKALVPVCGVPLLERSLEFCLQQGIKKIGVNAHYLADRIAAFCDDAPHPFTLFHEEGKIRGTGGGLYFAREFLAGDEIFFVCNVDIVYQFNLKPLVKRFLKSGWTGCLLATPPQGTGTVFYDPVSGLYGGTPADALCPPGMAAADFIGAALYRKEFLDHLTGDDFSVVPVWKRTAERGGRIGVLMVDKCFWRDIGTPAALAEIHRDLLDGKIDLPVPRILLVDRRGKRCFNYRLVERLRTCVGPYAWVEPSVFPDGCRIERSIVWDDGERRITGDVRNRIVTPHCEVEIDG
jgi:mannose-1-phosphate guanylyltransferase